MDQCIAIWGITIIQEIIRFFHLFVDSSIGANCHHKAFTGQGLPWENFIHPKHLISHTQMSFSGKKQIPKWAPLTRVVQPIRLPENPGITRVCIVHWTSWLQTDGYHIHVWDNIKRYAHGLQIVLFSVVIYWSILPISFGILHCHLDRPDSYEKIMSHKCVTKDYINQTILNKTFMIYGL